MSDAPERHCSSCSKRLNSNNTTGTCTRCRAGKAPVAPTEGSLTEGNARIAFDMNARIRARHKEQRKKFDQLCQLIGQDPDELVACFVEEKITTIQDAVRRAMGSEPVARAEVDD